MSAETGATALFVPTNNALPPQNADVVNDARNADIARATENGVWVIRADVAGQSADLMSDGSSGIVDPRGTVVQRAHQLTEDLLVADIDTAVHEVKDDPGSQSHFAVKRDRDRDRDRPSLRSPQ